MCHLWTVISSGQMAIGQGDCGGFLCGSKFKLQGLWGLLPLGDFFFPLVGRVWGGSAHACSYLDWYVWDLVGFAVLPADTAHTCCYTGVYVMHATERSIHFLKFFWSMPLKRDAPQSCIVGWRRLVAAWNKGGGKGRVCQEESWAGLLYFGKFIF